MHSLIDSISCFVMVFVMCALPIVATLGILAIIHMDARDVFRAERRQYIEACKRALDSGNYTDAKRYYAKAKRMF